ncbi:MAG: ABC transporter substrate-binding protein [Dehalococcoidia bacterium]
MQIGSWTTSEAVGKYGPTPRGVLECGRCQENLYDNLIIFDPYQNNEVLAGILAPSWSFNDDATQLTLNLLKGVQWHDGKPFTAADVVSTMQLHNGQRSVDGFVQLGTSPYWTTVLTDIRAVDDNTVVFDLSQPSASLLPRLTASSGGGSIKMWPAHIPLEELAGNPTGTAAFKFKADRRDVFVELQRNDASFRKDPEGRALPYLDGVRYNQFQDETLLLAAFRTAKIEYLDVFHGPTVTPRIDQLTRAIPGLVLDDYAQTIYGANLKNEPPWNDSRVAEAMDLWTDRKELLEVETQGFGSFYPSGVLPVELGGQWGLPPKEIMSRPGYRYLDTNGNLIDSLQELEANRDTMVKDPADMARAKELLAEAGIEPGTIKPEMLMMNVVAQRSGPTWARQMSKLFEATWTIRSPVTATEYVIELIFGRFEIGFHNYGGFGVDEPYSTYEVFGGLLGAPPVADGFGRPENIVALFNEQDLELDVAKRREIIYDLQRASMDLRIRLFSLAPLGHGANRPEVKNRPFASAATQNVFTYDRVWLER